MAGRVRRLLRRLGYDLLPYPGAAPHWARIASLLAHHEIDFVLDVGANTGQYATALRHNGYRGRILSLEPVATAHAALTRAAATDSRWQVAPRCAVGESDRATVVVHAAAESDMSSLLPMTEEGRLHMPGAARTTAETVPMVSLQRLWPEHIAPDNRVFLKIDTQGYEDRILDGLGDHEADVTGIQIEMGLQPVYQGQPDGLTLQKRLASTGFTPVFVVPGYYSRHLHRMIDFDMLWFRCPGRVSRLT